MAFEDSMIEISMSEVDKYGSLRITTSAPILYDLIMQELTDNSKNKEKVCRVEIYESLDYDIREDGS